MTAIIPTSLKFARSFAGRTRQNYLVLSALFFIFFSSSTLGTELKPFTTDGCSLFPDGNLVDDSKWVTCCVKHDLAYWQGGTKPQRAKADSDLQQCVEEVGDKHISAVMHLGVKIGGAPVYPTWYRWGYGWPYSRSYKQLTKDELLQVETRLKELRNIINDTIDQTSRKSSSLPDKNK